MASFQENMSEYRRQLQKGAIREAYRGLMQYLSDLRAQFQRAHPGDSVSGSIYQGYMDMTFFSFAPPSLKSRNLKAAVVFLHEPFRFEAWLAGANKLVQAQYWRVFRDSGWNEHRVVSTTQGADSIVECVLVDDPDFGDLDALTQRISAGAVEFVESVERFLDRHPA